MVTVAEVMIRKIRTIEEKESILSAVRAMKSFKVGSLVVMSKKGATGIVTTTDILNKAVAKELNLKKTQIRKIVSRPLIVIRPEATIDDAAAVMTEKKIKKLPVVDRNNKLVGIITATDIVIHSPRGAEILVDLRGERIAQAFGA